MYAGLNSCFVHGLVCKRFHALIWGMTCLCMFYLSFILLAYTISNICISPIACVSNFQHHVTQSSSQSHRAYSSCQSSFSKSYSSCIISHRSSSNSHIWHSSHWFCSNHAFIIWKKSNIYNMSIIMSYFLVYCMKLWLELLILYVNIHKSKLCVW